MKKYVNDVFDIDQYISKGITKFFLISGVGSGKSTWVKEVLAQKGSVLFVTSRKAKAESDISNSTFTDIVNWYTCDNQTLVTNAGLARRIENVTLNSSRDLDDFINCFDYIVIDEVHSIATDSIFADSCHTVLSFIEYVAGKNKPLICMTGTPEPVQYYFKENNWFILNYLNKCNYVHPSQVTLIHQHSVIREIQKVCGKNKVLYFANRTNSIINNCIELIESNIFSPSEIAIAVSKSREDEYFENLKKDIKDKGIRESIIESSKTVYDSIINANCLPDKCKVLFSTSTLKEGIDIDNENIVMFCENHDLSSLIQYFGRARRGKTKVYVIEDSTDHIIQNDDILYDYAAIEETNAANNYLEKQIQFNEKPLSEIEIYRLSNHVTKNPYIYYDIIHSKFKTYYMKFREKCRVRNNVYWKQNLLKYCFDYEIQLICPDNKTFMRDALKIMADKKDRYYGNRIALIQRVIYVAYNIEKVQPKKINEELEQLGAPIRIHNGTESKGENRNKKYWQVLFVDDYNLIK